MGSFIREVELDTINETLIIHQQEIGDVGCVVWDAAIVLSKYLESISFSNELNLKGLKVFELGAGLGCVGLTTACFGADVTMTDLPELIPLLQKNILANEELWKKRGGTAVAKPLKWSKDFKIDEWFQPDLIIMADCIYYMESVEELVVTITKLCDESTEVILCQEERDTEKQKAVWDKFLKSFKEIFDFYYVPENNQHPLFHSSDIFIIRAKKKRNFSSTNNKNLT